MILRFKTVLLLTACSILIGISGGVAFAADIAMDDPGLPAVSGPNGKLEFGGGWVDLDGLGSDELFRGGVTLSFPVGDMFGIQADLAVVDAYSDTAASGTLHAFTRDPNSFLLGMIGGYLDVGPADAWYIGPEAELYLDNISLEARVGYMDLDNGTTSDGELFAFGDIALYATDDLRLQLGGRTVAGFASAHAGMEWFMSDAGLPASLKLDGYLGEDGYASVTAGFAIYFGGEDKSLIRRHREDDPRNFSMDIFSAAAGGAALVNDTPVCPDGEFWNGMLCEDID